MSSQPSSSDVPNIFSLAFFYLAKPQAIVVHFYFSPSLFRVCATTGSNRDFFSMTSSIQQHRHLIATTALSAAGEPQEF
jgi:hypothetical protein